MFLDVVQISANMIKPSIDASCRMNGIQCNIYYKQFIEGVTQITGRGEIGTNENSFYNLPDFYKKPLLISEQTKVGYKGASKRNNPKGIESIDGESTTKESPQTHIVTYEKQYGIEWKPMMKIEVFYNRHSTYPDVVYQTSEIKEVPLPNSKTIHSGLIHVYLIPFM